MLSHRVWTKAKVRLEMWSVILNSPEYRELELEHAELWLGSAEYDSYNPLISSILGKP